MSLSPEEIVKIKNRLAEARDAYHRISMSRQPVEIRDSDGSSIRYNTNNLSRLKAYIAELESELLGCGVSQFNKRPLRPVWG